MKKVKVFVVSIICIIYGLLQSLFIIYTYLNQNFFSKDSLFYYRISIEEEGPGLFLACCFLVGGIAAVSNRKWGVWGLILTFVLSLTLEVVSLLGYRSIGKPLYAELGILIILMIGLILLLIALRNWGK